MSAHTPGPWSFRLDRNGLIMVGPSHNCTVADVYNPPVGTAGANARLIAAAPDLLAALEQISADYRYCVESDPPHPSYGDRAKAYAETARAAIAKAIGDAK